MAAGLLKKEANYPRFLLLMTQVKDFAQAFNHHTV